VAVFADGSQLPAPADFVEPGPARQPDGGAADGGRRVGMTAPARTPPDERPGAAGSWMGDVRV